MNRHRIETERTIWEFDLDRMMYLRIPKTESLTHPSKPYERKEIPFFRVRLGNVDSEGWQQFYVYNTGIKWGNGAVTESWALPGQNFSWLQEMESNE